MDATPRATRTMSQPRGFTLVEVFLVISITAALLLLATRTFGAVQSRYAADQGRYAFQALHARARAQAIETGDPTRLVVDVDADSVAVVRNGRILETVYFGDGMGIDLQGTSLVLCMGPRGFAITDCNSFNTAKELVFSQGSYTRALDLLPLGQLVLR